MAFIYIPALIIAAALAGTHGYTTLAACLITLAPIVRVALFFRR